MTSSEQFTPTGGQTIFPRINFLKTFSSRFDQRSTNGRIFLSGGGDLFAGAALDLNLASSLSLTDSISGNNLVTFSRASSGTYVGSDGLIKTAVDDEPRFDHDPVTGESLGLLIEEARTNLLTYSEQFDQSAWTKMGTVSVTPNVAIAPDGTQTAANIRRSSTDHHLYQTCSGTGVHILSVFVRSPSGDQDFNILHYNSTDGTLGDQTIYTATTEWQRFEAELSPTVNGNWYPASSINVNVDLEIWGAQLEKGSFPTSYIPTTGSTVTRSPDIATIEGSNFSSWYNQSEGTVFSEFRGLRLNGRVVAYDYPKALITNKDTTNQAWDGSIATNSLTDSGLVLGDFRKAASAYGGTTTTLTLQGLEPVTGNSDFTTTPPTLLVIGRATSTSDVLNGHISRLAYFPTRKTDQELIDLTN